MEGGGRRGGEEVGRSIVMEMFLYGGEREQNLESE